MCSGNFQVAARIGDFRVSVLAVSEKFVKKRHIFVAIQYLGNFQDGFYVQVPVKFASVLTMPQWWSLFAIFVKSFEPKMDSSPFEALDKLTYVIFYESKTEAFLNLARFADEDHTLIDVSTSEKLKSHCLKHYEPKELPFMLYRGGIVYSSGHIGDQLDSIDKKNTEKYRSFVSDFVSPEGLTVFMKGTMEQPKCKFSRQLIHLLRENNLSRVKEYDILSNQGLRYYMKFITSWPTFPQIFVNGRFLGGLDNFSELAESKRLEKEFRV